MNELQEFDRMPLSQMRERIIEQLQLQYAHDNLQEAEFEARLDRAHDAVSKQELAELVSDLPVLSDKPTASAGLQINNGTVQPSSTVVAILGGATRKGLWRPARHSTVVSVLGGVDLDYSQAQLPPGVTELEVFCLLGGVDITVPDGLAVEVQAIPILGGVDNRAPEIVDGHGPTLRVRAFTVLGGVDIKPKKKRRRGRRRGR